MMLHHVKAMINIISYILNRLNSIIVFSILICLIFSDNLIKEVVKLYCGIIVWYSA